MKFFSFAHIFVLAQVSALAPVSFRTRTSRGASVRASASFVPSSSQEPVQPSSFNSPQPTSMSTSQSSPMSTSMSPINESGVSIPLVRAIWSNQASVLLGSTLLAGACVLLSNHGDITGLADLHWNGSGSIFSSFFDWRMTPTRVLEGVAAAAPLVALGSIVESSDNRDACHINFSTTNMVIRLFGRRKSPTVEPSYSTSTTHMMALSLTIALSSGIAEELLFRGFLPTGLFNVFHSVPLALLAQAGLFAAGHLSPYVSTSENKIISGLQFVNGIWYGLIYLFTGDLLPVIVAHVLYEMDLFCGSWTRINNQLDYTQRTYPNRLDPAEEQRIAEQAGPDVSMESVNFARRFFYAFDSEHVGSLSHSDVQRAMTYAFLQDKLEPTTQEVSRAFRAALATREDQNGRSPERLSVSEFVRMLFTLKRQSRVR